MKAYLAIAAVLALTACDAGHSPPVSNASTPAPDAAPSPIMVMDEKAMYAAETLYNVPAQAYVVADSKGQLSPSVKAAVKPVLVEGYRYLVACRSFYKIGDGQGFAKAVDELRKLSNQATALLPKPT